MLHRIPGMLPAEQARTKLRDMQIARTLSDLVRPVLLSVARMMRLGSSLKNRSSASAKSS
jgi:hypothetical protein